MLLGELKVGEIDARYEIGDTESVQRFELGFTKPPNFPLEDFIEGNRFLVHGAKGTGKTAILRHVEIESNKIGIDTHFVLFKSEFSESEKGGMARAANVSLVDINPGPSDEETEHVAQWKLYIYGILCNEVIRNGKIFLHTTDADEFRESLILTSKPGFSLAKFAGTVDVSLTPKAALTFEFTSDKSKTKAAEDACRSAERILRRLRIRPNITSFRLFFDELEVSPISEAKRNRDARIIRDLIRALASCNELFSQEGIPIRIFAAIRSDVLTLPPMIGYEMNKITSPFGYPVRWDQKIPDEPKLHPLAQLAYAKIAASQGIKSAGEGLKIGDWERYFSRSIKGQPSQKYFLHLTWFRPRDIVVLLNQIISTNRKSIIFGEAEFESGTKAYASERWNELAEELTTSYTSTQVDGIKKLLTGMKQTFNVADIDDAKRRKRNLYATVASLANNPAADICADLFRLGAIGNRMSDRHERWVFRGDEDALLEDPFVLHKALSPILSVRRN